jgi:hypothetical protein
VDAGSLYLDEDKRVNSFKFWECFANDEGLSLVKQDNIDNTNETNSLEDFID